jgi:hypothetical protein
MIDQGAIFTKKDMKEFTQDYCRTRLRGNQRKE